MDCFLSSLAGLVLARSQDAVVLGNDFLSSFVAVSGDAHQAKVAQDLFRQEVRYERSLQIREDIRDVNKCMMESVQTHVLMGSIILAVCFSMSIEGYPGVRTERLLDLLWLLFTSWASTFTFVALWLALRFQMKISGSARERLLRRHRFMVPDDLVVGKMGGENLVNQMANFHSWVLETMDDMVSAQTDEETLQEKCQPIFLKQTGRPLRVPVESLDAKDVDAEPLRKGFHAWHHENGKGYSQNKTLEVPYFLVGETCVRMPWSMLANGPSLKIRVYGDATLYVSAQVVPGDAPLPEPSERKSKSSFTSGGSSPQTSPMSAAGVRKALRLESTVPAWPADELPLVRTGFNEKWRGESGYGEFRRVEGFSIFVDTQNAMELPLYKIVLASPSDFDEEYVDVVIQWNFKTACEALTVVLRRGHVHCKEEDFPLFEFNTEVKKMLPLRRYAGNFLAEGTICLLVATCLLMTGRMYNLNINVGTPWVLQVSLSIAALLPGCVLLRIMPVETAHSEVLQIGDLNEPKQSIFTQFRRTMSGRAVNRSGLDLGLALKRLNSRDSGAVRSDSAGSELDEENYTSDLADRLAAMEALERSGSEDESAAGHAGLGDFQAASPNSTSVQRTELSSMSFGCCSPESAPCREVIQAASSQVHAVTTSCQNVWRVPPESLSGTKRYRRRVSAYSDPRTYVKTKAPETRAVRLRNSLRALWADLNHGLERPRALQFWTAILHAMFGLSLLSAVVVRLLLGLLPEGPGPAPMLNWAALPAAWPPFFQPTAAMWEGGMLVAASGSILQKFVAEENGLYQPVGPALAVPGNVRGMDSLHEHVAVISDEGYFYIGDLNSSWINITSSWTPDGGPLGLSNDAGQATAATVMAAAKLPFAPAVELSAASVSGGGSPGAAAVAIVGSDGLLRLCRLPSLPGEPLEVLLELTLGLGQAQGLRLCRAAACGSNEALLWVADSQSNVHAVSLESGDIRATFVTELPAPGARLVALGGNSSHLVALLVLDNLEPQLVATPYPSIPHSAVAEL